LPRKKKPDPLDQFAAWIKAKADQASIRDLAYLASYVGAVYIAYEALTGEILPQFLDWTNILPFKIGAPKDEEPKEFKPKAFATALVVSYMVLKIDVSDMTSAIGKLGKAALTGLTTLSPVP
jgi:hypothetical protein